MKEYYLDQEDLLKIAVFNGIGGHYGYKAKTLPEQIKDLNEKFFNHVLKVSPKKQYIVDSFLKKYSEQHGINNFSPIRLFSEELKDKIEINELIEPIFASNYVFREDSDRLKFFKKLFDKNPQFLKITHDYIKSQQQQNSFFINSSTNLFDAYFQFLKNKNSLKIKQTIPNNEILENIDCFSTDKPSYIKKQINAYLSCFNNDEKLYKHILDKLGKHIENNGTVKIYWEEKLNNFDKSVISQYKSNDKSDIQWGNSEELYMYNFYINTEYVISKSHLTQSQASYLTSSLISTMGNFLSKNYNGNLLFSNNNQPNKFTIVFDNEKDRNRVSSFCNHIQQNLEEIITGYFKKDKSYSILGEQLTEYFSKLNLAYDLDKQLAIKEDSNVNKSIKRKI